MRLTLLPLLSFIHFSSVHAGFLKDFLKNPIQAIVGRFTRPVHEVVGKLQNLKTSHDVFVSLPDIVPSFIELRQALTNAHLGVGVDDETRKMVSLVNRNFAENILQVKAMVSDVTDASRQLGYNFEDGLRDVGLSSTIVADKTIRDSLLRIQAIVSDFVEQFNRASDTLASKGIVIAELYSEGMIHFGATLSQNFKDIASITSSTFERCFVLVLGLFVVHKMVPEAKKEILVYIGLSILISVFVSNYLISEQMGIIATPGKRGPVGPPGPMGPTGATGAKGEPGVSPEYFQNEIKNLLSRISKLEQQATQSTAVVSKNNLAPFVTRVIYDDTEWNLLMPHRLRHRNFVFIASGKYFVSIVGHLNMNERFYGKFNIRHASSDAILSTPPVMADGWAGDHFYGGHWFGEEPGTVVSMIPVQVSEPTSFAIELMTRNGDVRVLHAVEVLIISLS